MARPVAAKYEVSQRFASFPTAGVIGDPEGSVVQQLVWEYGNYQPFGHAGEDIACPIGTPVYAIDDGEVVWADWGYNLPGDDSDLGYRARWYFYKLFPGILTVIRHSWGYSAYAHLSDNNVAPVGTRVTAGQHIAYSGNTGGVAAHLHVEALIDLNFTTGNGLIYGRTDPQRYYGLSTALHKASPAPKQKVEEEVPQFTRITTPAVRRTLAKDKAWYLKDASGKSNLNLAGGTGGLGHYDVALFLQGANLPAGETVTVQFFIVKNGKRSGYWTQEVHGSTSGKYRATVPFKMPILEPAAIEVAVTSSFDGATLDVYGADVYNFQKK